MVDLRLPLRSLWSGCREAFDTLLFPTACQVCGVEGVGGAFCVECRQELAEAQGLVCPRCAMPVGPHAQLEGGCAECRERSLGFDAAIALGPYQGPIRHLCLRLKHEREAWLARWMADLMIEARGEPIRAVGASAVVPIPLHWRRRRQRGYNQSEALAKYLANGLGLRLARPLRRVKATATLARMGRVQRHRLMQGAFAASSRAARALAGQSVLLLDDILTSGATCGAAARTLKQAGVARVVVVVVGRAEGLA